MNGISVDLIPFCLTTNSQNFQFLINNEANTAPELSQNLQNIVFVKYITYLKIIQISFRYPSITVFAELLKFLLTRTSTTDFYVKRILNIEFGTCQNRRHKYQGWKCYEW